LDADKRGQVDEQLSAAGLSRMGFKAADRLYPQDRL
jgi:hypothetical protein